MNTKKKLNSVTASIACFVILALGVSHAFAQEDNNYVGMVTGSSTGTYIQFGNDISKVTADAGLNIRVKESKGSLDNIRRMLSKENAALGVVQSDVLGFLTRSSDKNLQRVARNLRLVFPLYNEEVHLFADKSIESINDLEGKRVVVGNKGSGNWLTSTNLLKLMNVNPSERLGLDPNEGLTAVLTGKAEAMFYVAGKPVKLFSNLEKLVENPVYEKLLMKTHLVPLDQPEILSEYVSAGISPADYTWMDSDVSTAAVKAVLVSFNFAKLATPYYRTRCDQLAIVGERVYTEFENLRTSGHPKWNEVDLDEKIGIWERDACSAKRIAQLRARKTAPVNDEEDDFLTKGLLECVTTGKCK